MAGGPRRRRLVRPLALALAAACALVACMPPSWGANALLHPPRRPIVGAPALPHRDFAVDSDGATIRGWIFPAQTSRRAGTVVYLHGVADNRASGVWIAERLVREGFDVVAYDSRAHGESGGDACTYGYYEKKDLSRVLHRLGIERAIVVGVSLGAAVALQAAADDPRIVAVVSVATFSSLEEIAHDRVRRIATDGQIRKAFAIAEREGRFEVALVSPVRAAARIRVPVLVVFGSGDSETPTVHSRRVFEALAGPKRIEEVLGAGHDDALVKAWERVDRWIAGQR